MHILKWIIILFLVAGLAGMIYVGVKLGQPATTVSLPQDFEIERGERAGQIVDRLVERGVVRSELILEIYLRFKNAEEKLQAGVYELDSNMTIPEIVQALTRGLVKATGTRVTVIEGWTARDVASRLETLGVAGAVDFMNIVNLPDNEIRGDYGFLSILPAGASLEGFLFPDTYLMKPEDGAEGAVRKMLDNFKNKVSENFTYEDLILASMVEKEVGRNVKAGTVVSEETLEAIQNERRLVASVFRNRLRLGMALESDATIGYITGSDSPRATFAELNIVSPYNTYKVRGLPPGPISNPSIDSIRAAITPAQSDYYFFLTEPDGTAHFARTFAEHQRNRELYLE